MYGYQHQSLQSTSQPDGGATYGGGASVPPSCGSRLQLVVSRLREALESEGYNLRSILRIVGYIPPDTYPTKSFQARQDRPSHTEAHKWCFPKFQRSCSTGWMTVHSLRALSSSTSQIPLNGECLPFLARSRRTRHGATSAPRYPEIRECRNFSFINLVGHGSKSPSLQEDPAPIAPLPQLYSKFSILPTFPPTSLIATANCQLHSSLWGTC
jgi:hypothetical protein